MAELLFRRRYAADSGADAACGSQLEPADSRAESQNTGRTGNAVASARAALTGWLDRPRRTTADASGSVAASTSARAQAIHSGNKAERGFGDRLDGYGHCRVPAGWLYGAAAGNRGVGARPRRALENQKIAGEIRR